MSNENETLPVDALEYEDELSLADEGEDLAVDELDSVMDEAGSIEGTVKDVQVWSTSPKIILAAANVIYPDASLMNVTATVGGGAVTLTSNPSIANGINGQILVLRGSSATDTITITDGNGVLLAGTITLGLDDTVTLYFDGLVNNKWVEIARNLNTVQTYAATNVTTDRAYDADTVVVAELADVVGTLIADLRAWGIVK